MREKDKEIFPVCSTIVRGIGQPTAALQWDETKVVFVITVTHLHEIGHAERWMSWSGCSSGRWSG